jgi:hypothetical protein
MRRKPRGPRATALPVLLSAVSCLVTAANPGSGTAQEGHALLVVGLGGTEEYRTTFHRWATESRDALVALGMPRQNITYLGERPDERPGEMDGEATREGLERAVDRMAGRAGPDDRILVVLIGHGTSRGDDVSFNLPGPDVSPAEMAALLDGAFGRRPVAVVNTASASGPFVAAITGEHRVIVTATRTAQERNETRFGRFFVEALQGEAADLDKDGRLSILEVFRYASSEVARHYEEENLILTEHAMLDDNGDGEGSSELDDGTGDGTFAGSFWVGATRVVAAGGGAAVQLDSISDPVLRRLYEEKTEIEGRITALRLLREQMEASEYDAQLEELLVQLALKNREIEAQGGGG